MAYTFNGKANINNTGNSTFGNITQTNTTGDYITNKKAKLLFDMNSNKKRFGSLLNQNNLLLLKRAQLIKNIGICQSLPAFNSANLVSGLHSTENLTGINIITSVNDGSACPIYSGATLYPDLIIAKPIYYNYEVDKCGSLFGNNICGIENYNDYKIINKPADLSSQSLLDCYLDENVGSLERAEALSAAKCACERLISIGGSRMSLRLRLRVAPRNFYLLCLLSKIIY